MVLPQAQVVSGATRKLLESEVICGGFVTHTLGPLHRKLLTLLCFCFPFQGLFIFMYI
jgi:hypothetical protein